MSSLTVGELEFLVEAQAAFRILADRSHDPDTCRHYRNLTGEARQRVEFAKRQIEAVMVFDLSIPGYIRIGPEGREVAFPHPGLLGLEDAWKIHLHGVNAASTLSAADLVGQVKQPANALRNRLKEAANWIQLEAHLPELARYLRRPFIEVGRDGTIRCKSGSPLRLLEI